MARRAPIVDVDAVADEAFGLSEDLDAFTSREHQHRKHQLLYAATGTMTLSAGGQRWILPPQRAAWIAAGTPHVVASGTGIGLRTVYFAEESVPKPTAACSVFGVVPLAREMILHAMCWGPCASSGARAGAVDATRTAFFRALGGLMLEWIADAGPYALPQARTEELARALRFIDANVAPATSVPTFKAHGWCERWSSSHDLVPR